MGGRIQVVGDGAAALQSFYTVRVPSSRDSSRSARARPTMLTHDNIDFSTFSSQNCALDAPSLSLWGGSSLCGSL